MRSYALEMSFDYTKFTPHSGMRRPYTMPNTSVDFCFTKVILELPLRYYTNYLPANIIFTTLFIFTYVQLGFFLVLAEVKSMFRILGT